MSLTTVIKDDAYKELKKVIDNRGIKVKFIAGKIGITPNYLGQILNGTRNLSAEVAIKASQELGLPLTIFLNRS